MGAYATLARGGFATELFFDANQLVKPSTLIFSPETSYVIGEILSRPENRILTCGLDSPLTTPFWAAVETGTSKDMRDNWCVGYSEHFTVGVWVGNFRGTPMWNVSGTTGAAPLWLSMMKRLNEYKPSQAPQIPAGIKNIKDELQDMSYSFLTGTDFRPQPLKSREMPSRIEYPVEGSVFAVDPDIPVHQQKIIFQAAEVSRNYYWYLNDAKLANAKTKTGWTPKPGEYKLALVESGQKRARAEVHFVVK